jgi:hypothetical protein
MDEGLRKGCHIEIDETDDRWKYFEPVKESDMEMIGHRTTVCELLREIYKASDDPLVRLKCRMATSMAKLMAQMITDAKGRGWGKDYYPWNPLRRHERMKARFAAREELNDKQNTEKGEEDGTHDRTQ